MKYKRNLIIILVAIILYVILTFIYNNIVIKSNEIIAFVVSEDIEKGNKIDIEKLFKITLKSSDNSLEYTTDISNLDNMLLNSDIKKGQIITKEILIEKDSYIKSNKDEEIVAIKIKSPEDSASYNLNKNSLVNIYYTGKSDFASEILMNLNGSNIVSGGNPGYMTVEILKNVKIINIYDKYGNEINYNNLQSNNEIVIDTILISTDSKTAMNIYNLSRYGDFSISVLK